MRTDVTITVSEDLQRLFKRLAEAPQLLLQAVGRGLAAAGPVIVGNAVKDRFTAQRGPFPVGEHKLGRVTGRLRQSITNTKPQIHGESGEVTMGFGSNVSYFATHEFGFAGAVPVRAHKRRNGSAVRAHSRNVRIAARAPMTTELQQQRTEAVVVESVRRAVVRALESAEGGLA